jgi:anti-sigma factor RsiW
MDSEMNKDSQFPEAELARLADGSLPASRQAELRGELKRSPELARALAEQERAVTLLRSADEVQAPDSLRQRIEEQAKAAGASRRRVRPRPRVRLRLAIPSVSALAAAVAVAVVLIASGGGTSAPTLAQPTLAQATHLTLASATSPAPVESRSGANTLDDSAAGIPFPYWRRSVAWNAVGARADRVSGREITTVFYASQSGTRVGYAIVGGSPLPVHGGSTVSRHGVQFTLLNLGGARLVTWLRSGHTCVIAGRSVSDRTLLRLASSDIPQ